MRNDEKTQNDETLEIVDLNHLDYKCTLKISDSKMYGKQFLKKAEERKMQLKCVMQLAKKMQCKSEHVV